MHNLFSSFCTSCLCFTYFQGKLLSWQLNFHKTHFLKVIGLYIFELFDIHLVKVFMILISENNKQVILLLYLIDQQNLVSFLIGLNCVFSKKQHQELIDQLFYMIDGCDEQILHLFLYFESNFHNLQNYYFVNWQFSFLQIS